MELLDVLVVSWVVPHLRPISGEDERKVVLGKKSTKILKVCQVHVNDSRHKLVEDDLLSSFKVEVKVVREFEVIEELTSEDVVLVHIKSRLIFKFSVS